MKRLFHESVLQRPLAGLRRRREPLHSGSQFAPQYQYPFRMLQGPDVRCPVKCVTPHDGDYTHTFYDVCPFSPSGRYLAVTRLPRHDSRPILGDLAHICVIDLHERVIRTIRATKAWGIQLGANLEWGESDDILYSNDVVGGKAVCIRIHIPSGETTAFGGPKYHLSPHMNEVVGFPLRLMNRTQPGYGIPDPRWRRPSMDKEPEEEGIWITDLQSGRPRLVLSLAQGARALSRKADLSTGAFYFAHSRFNRHGSLILQVIRLVRRSPRSRHGRRVLPALLTFDRQGTSLREAVDVERWAAGGHHPSWVPGGERILMNLTPRWLGDDAMRFCSFLPDGSDFRVHAAGIPGGGHPSLDPGGRYLITDAYPSEPLARPTGEVPIRLIDLGRSVETRLCYVPTLGTGRGEFRLDPHPAWDRTSLRVCFNGLVGGRRQVLVAELEDHVSLA